MSCQTHVCWLAFSQRSPGFHVCCFLYSSHIFRRQPWAGRAYSHSLLGYSSARLIWIVLLSLIALSVASWVKWRIVATGLLFAAMFVPAGVGTVFNAVMRTKWGNLINIPYMM